MTDAIAATAKANLSGDRRALTTDRPARRCGCDWVSACASILAKCKTAPADAAVLATLKSIVNQNKRTSREKRTHSTETSYINHSSTDFGTVKPDGERSDEKRWSGFGQGGSGGFSGSFSMVFAVPQVLIAF